MTVLQLCVILSSETVTEKLLWSSINSTELNSHARLRVFVSQCHCETSCKKKMERFGILYNDRKSLPKVNPVFTVASHQSVSK